MECFITPIADDPTDPLILAAVGTTIFSGGLIAQSALNPKTVVVVEEQRSSTYLPILIEEDDTEDKQEDEQISITISSGESQPASEDGSITSNIDTNVVVIGREAVNEASGIKEAGKNNRRGLEEKQKRKGQEVKETESGQQKPQRGKAKLDKGKRKHNGNKHSKNKKNTNKEKRKKGETKRSQQNTPEKRAGTKITSEESIKRNTTSNLASAIASAITDSLGNKADDLLGGIYNDDSLSLRAPQGRLVAGDHLSMSLTKQFIAQWLQELGMPGIARCSGASLTVAHHPPPATPGLDLCLLDPLEQMTTHLYQP